jgi:RNA ligase (TIGR02306 family)
MSTFAVTFRKIANVRNHPNADRLDVASVEGSSYQFVIGRGQFKIGDAVLYFPIDAVMPQAILEKVGLVGKLAGKDKNRIKTVNLRGEISQGIVIPPSDVFPTINYKYIEGMTPEALTEHLGVTKYIPPEKPCHFGNLKPLPDGQSMYDIENAENHAEVVDLLMDREVVITEKVEGSNFSVSVSPEGAVSVNQRCNSIEPVPEGEHDFWKVAKSQGLIDDALAIHAEEGNKHVVIYGEYLGPSMMGNIYKFPRNLVLCFDLKIDYKFADWAKVESVRKWRRETHHPYSIISWVPVLFVGKLRDFIAANGGKPLAEISDGKSALGDTPREGIVIKPLVEGRTDYAFGRLIVKQRSPKYLCGAE